jgi:nucleotide-binding universal stress UspA family protein
MTVRSILCPVDFYPQSRKALQYALALARRFGSRLTVMFVNDPLLIAAANAADRGQRRFVDRTNAELARLVKQLTPTGRREHESVALIVSVGNPAEEILRETKRLRSDFVVMASHGLSGIRKVLSGSTTEQVLRRATVPVLAIPPSIGSRPTVGRTIEFARVIAPIDLAGEWHSDAIRAAKFAGEFDAPLLLVHVLARVQTLPWLRSAAHSNERRRIEKAQAALERVRTKLFADLPSMSTLVVVGDPAHEIARLTNRRGSLVVMSLRGTAGVRGMRRGSIAYHVLTHSTTPVLALPRRRLGGRFPVRARKAINEILTARDRAEIAGIDALLSVGASRKQLKP